MGQPGLVGGVPVHGRGLELDDLYGPFQCKPFCDSRVKENLGQLLLGNTEELSENVRRQQLIRKWYKFHQFHYSAGLEQLETCSLSSDCWIASPNFLSVAAK